MYFGKTTNFIIGIQERDESAMQARASAFDNAFPKFIGGRASARVVQDWVTEDDGEQHSAFTIAATIPVSCRISAIFEDIDYTSPVWLNGLALTLYFNCWSRETALSSQIGIALHRLF